MAKKKGNTGTGASGIAARVEALVSPAIQQLGLVLWDVRYEKEGSEWYLKVLIDKPDGPMDTDTCELASRAIDPLLDEADPIPDSYYLEVGSPGLGRKLTRDAHYTALLGRKVAARLYKPDAAGRKEVAGTLLRYEDGVMVLEVEGEEYPLAKADAGSVRLCDDEDLFG